MKRMIETTETQDAPLEMKRPRIADDCVAALSDCTEEIESYTETKTDKSLTCQLCSQPYSDPRMLSCLHCFCRECLHRKLTEVKIKGTLNCPICKKPDTIPTGGVEDLPQDLHLGIDVHIAQYQSKVASIKIQQPCDVCIDSTGSGPAVGFCCSCHHFLCQLCYDHHKRARNFCQHNIVKMGESVSREQFSEIKPTCALHQKEFIFYCKKCACLMCYDCTTNKHMDHYQQITLPNTAASSCREDIRNLLTTAQNVVSKLTEATEGNNAMLKEVEGNEKAVSQSIEQKFVQLQQVLEERRKKLLKEVRDSALSKKTALTLQTEAFETRIRDVKSCVDFASAVLQTYTDCEIMALKQLISAGLRSSVHKTRNVSLDPFICNDIGKLVLQTDSYKSYLSQIGHLVYLCPGKSTWCSTSSLAPKENSPYMLRVDAKDSNRHVYTFDDVQLKVELTCVGSGFVVLGKVSHSSKGTYSISITPVSSGPHILSITMNHQLLQKSPSNLHVEAV